MKKVKILMSSRRLLSGLPYTEDDLNGIRHPEIKILASALGVNSYQRRKADIIKDILKIQETLEPVDERLDDFCEMCGHYVAIRQKAHIVSEGDESRDNILMLCPTCHLMFDTRLKPRLYKALARKRVKGLPRSWKKSIYHQGAEAGLLKWLSNKQKIAMGTLTKK